MYCSKCGNELKDSEQFCPKCGARTEKVKEDIKKSYEKEYEISKRTLKLSLISMLIVVIISVVLNLFSDFGYYVGKYLFIISAIASFVGLISCYCFSIKGKIKQSTWIHIILGVLIAFIIINIVSLYIEYKNNETYMNYYNYYMQNY